jgi:PKD repeat protein
LADAGLDQNITVGQTIILDGTGSYDVDGDDLTYQWISSIDGILGNGSILKDIKLSVGIHTIALNVSDGELFDIDTCIVRVFDKMGNLPPVAKISAITQIYEGTKVTLTAIGSYDEDGYIVQYTWDFGDGSNKIITNKTEVEHIWNSVGNFTITLTVLDNNSAIGKDSIIIVVLQSGGNDSQDEAKQSHDNTFVIILITVVIIVLLILAISKLLITRSKRQREGGYEHEFVPEPEDKEEILDNMKQKYLQDEPLPAKDYSRNEISELLEQRFSDGQLSEETYKFIRSEVLFSEEAPAPPPATPTKPTQPTQPPLAEPVESVESIEPTKSIEGPEPGESVSINPEGKE